MAYADLDKSAGKTNGAANGAALSLSPSQENYLKKLPKAKADKLRAKMLAAKAKEADSKVVNIKDAKPAPVTETKTDENEHEDEDEKAEGTTVVAGDHTLNVQVAAPAPVIVETKAKAPLWFEVVASFTHGALVFVAGAASWALFGTIIKNKLGV